MTLRNKLAIGLSGLLLIVVFWKGCQMGRSQTQSPATLPKNDKEQIIIDPEHHRLTVLTPSGPKVVTLPDKPSVIDIHNDESVQVTSPQSGFEHRFFFGIQGNNAFRVAVGMDAFYFKKLDIGFGMASEIRRTSPIAFVSCSYNVYSNVRLGIVYDSLGHFGGLLTIRI